MNTHIIVCCHKNDMMATTPPYYPLHVGKAISAETLSVQGDDAGANISWKNPCYCELTGIYWAWKNLKGIDIIGLCHYRRYFDFHHQVGYPHGIRHSETFPQFRLDVPQDILEKVWKGNIVVPCARYLRESVQMHFCVNHDSNDYRLLRDTINQGAAPSIRKAFRKVFHRGIALHPYNMFIMRWDDFDAYCSWLFSQLERVEHGIDVSQRDSYQRRVFGFMAERLLGVWITANGKQIIEKPIVCFDDSKPTKTGNSYLAYRINGWIKQLGFVLMRL